MAAHATRYFGQPDPEHRGPSFAVSIAATAMLFALAFGAMRSLPDLPFGTRSRVEAPIVVQLPPLAPPKPQIEPTPAPPTARRAESRVVPPATVPLGVPTPSQIAPPIAPPVAAPITSGASGSSAPRDSAAASRRASAEDYLHKSMVPPSTGLGAPAVPDWTKSVERLPNTEAVRNQIIHEKMKSIAELARTRAPTGREKAELEASQLAASMLQQRMTSGNSRDLVHLQGKGKDGVGAVGGPGIVSIDFPLFSSGPSKEQRKKNEAIDADYQLRLHRLGDRVLLKHDSLIADSRHIDSLRLDSLRRDSLARRPKSPSPENPIGR